MRSAPLAALRSRPPRWPAGWLSINATAYAAGRRELQLSVSGMPGKGMRSSQHARRIVVVWRKGRENEATSYRELHVIFQAVNSLPQAFRLCRCAVCASRLLQAFKASGPFMCSRSMQLPRWGPSLKVGDIGACYRDSLGRRRCIPRPVAGCRTICSHWGGCRGRPQRLHWGPALQLSAYV